VERKPEFKPAVTRVKLNPEQAVLQCNCFASGMASQTIMPEIAGTLACFAAPPKTEGLSSMTSMNSAFS